MRGRLPWRTVYELLRFRYENTHAAFRGHLIKPDLTAPVEVDDEALRSLILFANREMGNRDPRVPRHLEAWRVLHLVPEDIGADLFGVTAEDGAR